MNFSPRIARPHELDLDAPGRRDYLVALEHDSIWGDHLLPLTVFVGEEAQDGKGLVAFGANHGNEMEGPVALSHLMREINIDDVRGRLIFMPVLNVPAFKTGTRDTVSEDRVNLNRAFVDGAGTHPALAGITHRIARFVRELIWPRVHIVIDIHSGGQVARFAMVASFHPVDDPAQSRAIEETARWFGTPLVMTYQNATPGLLPSEAERLGKITVGTELGWGAATHREGVMYARQGVLAAAIRHGQLRGEIAPIAHHADGTQRRVAMVNRECFVPAPFAGHYEPVRDCGELVDEGELVGYLHDFDRLDLPPHPIRAGTRGVVLAQAWAAAVPQGQHILVIGQEMEWESES